MIRVTYIENGVKKIVVGNFERLDWADHEDLDQGRTGELGIELAEEYRSPHVNFVYIPLDQIKNIEGA